MLFLFLFIPALFAENIILFIGDGMGPSVINATRSHYFDGQKNLALDSFSQIALVTTHSKDNFVTDSAAAASAFACGQKVDNASICYPKKNTSIAKIAKDKAMLVGFIGNTTLSHATPAAFYANVENRQQEAEIAEALFQSPFDFMIGGATDKIRNAAAKQKNFLFYSELKDINSLNKPIMGFLSNGHFSFFEKEDSKSLLRKSIAKMLGLIANKKQKFFIIVESGRIDHALHRGDIIGALKESIDFDHSIRDTLDFLKKENLDDKTSIFVTADHDTAGIDLSGYPKRKKALIKNNKIAISDFDGLPVLRFLSNGKFSQNHSASDVLLYANGNCSKFVRGTIDNTEIYQILKSCIDN